MAKKQLIDEIIQRSIGKYRAEAKKEWDVVDVYYLEKDETWKQEFEECLCGQSNIIQVCEIENKHSHERVIIWNKCVNEFLWEDYSHLFKSLSKIKRNLDKSVGWDTIIYAFEEWWIDEKSKNFYLDILRKRILSEKQLQRKQNINSIIRKRLIKK